MFQIILIGKSHVTVTAEVGDEAASGRIEVGVVILIAKDGWQQPIGELFTEFHAPLIKRINAPNNALYKHFVLIQRQQHTKLEWIETRHQDSR